MDNDPSPPSPELNQFLILMAEKLFNQKVTIETYTAADNMLAFVRPPEPCIHVNLTGSNIAPWHRLVQDFKELSRDDWKKRHTETIVKWIGTLAHEMTHLQDGQSCVGHTHDPDFYKRVAKNLQPFIHRGTEMPLVMTTLEEILTKPEPMQF